MRLLSRLRPYEKDILLSEDRLTLFVPPLRIKVTGKSDTGAGRPREIISTVHLPIMRWGEVSIEKQPRLVTEDRGDGDEVETSTLR